MKIYLASRYSRRDEVKAVAEKLERMGHTITASWLKTDFPLSAEGSSAAPAEYREHHSQVDMEDVRQADCVISFTEPSRSSGRGGRHVEFGMAAAWGKRLIVVGHRENLFHHLPAVEFCESVEDLWKLLQACWPGC